MCMSNHTWNGTEAICIGNTLAILSRGEAMMMWGICPMVGYLTSFDHYS